MSMSLYLPCSTKITCAVLPPLLHTAARVRYLVASVHSCHIQAFSLDSEFLSFKLLKQSTRTLNKSLLRISSMTCFYCQSIHWLLKGGFHGYCRGITQDLFWIYTWGWVGGVSTSPAHCLMVRVGYLNNTWTSLARIKRGMAFT